MELLRNPQDLEALHSSLQKNMDPSKPCIRVCLGTGCQALGSVDVLKAFREEVKRQGLDVTVDTKQTGCHGFCERGPVVIIGPEEVLYQRVKPEDVKEIVADHISNGKVVERLLYQRPSDGVLVAKVPELDFFKYQTKLILKNCGEIDPENIEEYIATDGYLALSKALSSMSQNDVIQQVKTSGLRGRGGAGFPTGLKWQFTKEAKGDVKYVVANGDEGDPGAFSDRSLMEANPHRIIEGMIIGGYSVGAHLGYVYVRAEYPLAVDRLKISIDQAGAYGLLGRNILGSGFDFSIDIRLGAGAFVCGEETALLFSIEGKRGTPRPRPPFPAQEGLYSKPTLLNNVKTLAAVPLIIINGADWFSKIGTEKSKGTAIFSLVGKVNNTGLIEVPMGITLERIIYGIGGGILKNKKFKAVQTGGPSGGCIPKDCLETPVDYESLKSLGSIMGSGGLVVMDEDDCMVDVARFFLDFTVDESCGKCTPCREGNRRMLEILTRIVEGKGREGDIELLETMAESIKVGSLCGLGQTAPNPVLTTLKYFREEYEAHVKEKRCPALHCKSLLNYIILQSKCTACGACFKVCAVQAVNSIKTAKGETKFYITRSKCIRCGACKNACQYDAVVMG